MNSFSDTLDIKPTRPSAPASPAVPKAAPATTPTVIPMSAIEAAEHHPQAAAIARSRIAALPDVYPLANPADIPAVPTDQLITDRSRLANHYRTQPAVVRPELPSKLKPVLTAVGVFLLMLLVFKAPVIFSQAGYSFNKPAATPTPTAAAAAGAIVPADPTITIPKINVHAPVVYEPSVVEGNVQKSLEHGVVHYGNTPAPGEGGNSVIFGHSSNDWWEPGDYKFVFVLLDKLSPGDRFTVDYKSVRYTYEVTGSKVVEPTDLSVLSPTAEPTITLITCTPPGTSWKRLVITAKQVDPNPAKSAKTSSAASGNQTPSLPGAAPSFTDQLGQAWNGFIGLFGLGKKPAASPSPSPDSLPAIK